MCIVRLASSLQSDSIVDGEGLRTVIWFQGCAHNCKGCHNPESHDFNGGDKYNIDDIKREIDTLEFQEGITFSGGDPFYQPLALLSLAKYTHEKGMNVWIYTGFLYEELLNMSKINSVYMDVLKETDVLVDGKFILAKKSFDVKFRGSTNQRIIDVPKSLETNKVVLVPKYIYNES